jgi:hypothetical protein
MTDCISSLSTLLNTIKDSIKHHERRHLGFGVFIAIWSMGRMRTGTRCKSFTRDISSVTPSLLFAHVTAMCVFYSQFFHKLYFPYNLHGKCKYYMMHACFILYATFKISKIKRCSSEHFLKLKLINKLTLLSPPHLNNWKNNRAALVAA